MSNQIPKHVAIIMDGNRRWAKNKGLPVVAGHGYVVDKLIERLIEHGVKNGIEYMTFWAWSTENWKRGEEEVGGILKLFRKALEKKAGKLIKNGARVRIIGDIEAFPEDISKGLHKMMSDSEENDRINVNFALNYGGRSEILKAVENLTELRIKNNELRDKVKKEDFESALYTVGMPDPDLIIRPGGEKRLSGFMLWQSEYSELYFTDVLMPDFDEKEFDKALAEYGKRQRRRGK